MGHGKVGFGKERMCSYKLSHNSAVHTTLYTMANNFLGLNTAMSWVEAFGGVELGMMKVQVNSEPSPATDPVSMIFSYNEDGSKNILWTNPDYTPPGDEQVKNKHIPNGRNVVNNDNDWIFDNLTSYTGIIVGGAAEYVHSSTLETWMGKDGKTRSQDWGGNGKVGGKNKFAKKVGTGVKVGGYALGLYNFKSINDQYSNGQITGRQRDMEQVSNGISTAGGLYGVAWGLGWELGRLITNLPGYHENIRVPGQQFLGILPGNKECKICPLYK